MKSLIKYISKKEKTTDSWSKKLIYGLIQDGIENGHNGDCVNKPQPCSLCNLESLLVEYRKYCFKDKLTIKQQFVVNLIINLCYQRFEITQTKCKYDGEYLIVRKDNDNYCNIVVDEDGDTMISVFFIKNQKKSFRIFIDKSKFDIKKIEKALQFKKPN